MLLVNVRPVPKEQNRWFIEIQNGAKAYRGEPMTEKEVEGYVELVLIAMLQSSGLPVPVLDTGLPKPITELKKALTDGIGLSDDNKALIIVKKGKVTELDRDVRWRIAQALKIRVGKALNSKSHLRGEW